MSLIFHSTFHSVLYSIHIQYALGILFFLSSGTKIKRKKKSIEDASSLCTNQKKKFMVNIFVTLSS